MAKKTRMPLAIAMSVLGLLILSLTGINAKNRNIYSREKNIAIELSKTILTSIDASMKAGNQESIQSEFEKYKNQKNILEVSLINQDSEVKRSSDTSLLNQKLRQRNIEDALEGRDSLMLVMEGPRPGKSLVVTRSLKNTDDCFRCHDKNNKILGALKVVFDWTLVENKIKAGQQKTVLSALLGFAVIIAAVIVYFKNFFQ